MRPTLSHFLFALAALLLVSSSIVNTATGAGVTDERATRLGRLLEQWPKTEIMPLIHTADTIPQMEAALAEHQQQEVGDAMMMETRTEAAVESETELDEADQVANEIRAEMEAEEEANAKAKSAAAGPAPAEEAPTLLVEVSSQSSTQSDAESESESEADVEVENELDSEAGSVVVAEGEADHEQEADPIVTQQDEVHQVIQDFGLVEQAAQTESESDADAKTEAETESETVAETEAEVEAEAETEVEAATDADADADASSEVEAETEAEVEAEADSSVEDSAGIEEAKNILKVVSEADAAEHPALAEVAAQAESTARTETETETEAESEADSESESEAESAAEAADIEEAKSILGAVSEEAAEDYPALAEVSVAAETEAEAETETETEADADSETESEAADAADVANAKEILNAVSEESGEDYPALAETASTITVAAAAGAPTPATATVVAASSPISWSDHPVNIEAHSENEISPVMIPASHVVVNKASAKKLAAAIQSQEEVSTDPSLIALTSSIKKSGCGTGLTSTMVHSPRMASSCTAHDTCYATCGKKQAECDLAFKNDMLKYCNERFSAATAKAKAGFKICTGQANLYYLAVRRLGGAPFAAAQKQSNCDEN